VLDADVQQLVRRIRDRVLRALRKGRTVPCRRLAGALVRTIATRRVAG
jgi:hypothetical protein